MKTAITSNKSHGNPDFVCQRRAVVKQRKVSARVARFAEEGLSESCGASYGGICKATDAPQLPYGSLLLRPLPSSYRSQLAPATRTNRIVAKRSSILVALYTSAWSTDDDL
jgi:hypothetical protein